MGRSLERSDGNTKRPSPVRHCIDLKMAMLCTVRDTLSARRILVFAPGMLQMALSSGPGPSRSIETIIEAPMLSASFHDE
jgi:hypothetical protein